MQGLCAILFTDMKRDSWEIAGLSLQERMIRTLKKAGILQIFLLSSPLEETIQYLEKHRGPVVCLSSTTLLDYRLLGELGAASVKEGEVIQGIVPEKGQSSKPPLTHKLPLLLCSGTLIPLLIELLRQGVNTFESLEDALQERVTIHPLFLQGKFWYTLTSPESIKKAEEGLFNTLIKETDSPIAKRIDRKISLRISRLLVQTEITPNQITLVCLGIGLSGAFLLTIAQQGAQVTGALLFLISAILDGCDGEIARLKFLESRYGGWLDLLCDNVIHIALFWGMGWGLSRQYQDMRYLVLSGFATLGIALSVALVCWATLRHKPGTGPFFTSVIDEQQATRLKPFFHFLVKVNDLLARRDFSYIVVLCAVLGKLEWFLWGGAIGANLFWLSLFSMYYWGVSA